MIKKLRKRNEDRRVHLRNMPSSFDNGQISWIAPERIQHNRGKLWMSFMVVSVVAAAVWGIFYNAWTFSIAIVAFAVVYALTHMDHPEEVEVTLSDIGIKVGGRKYAFSKIKAFWVIYEPPFTKTLNIRVDGDLALDIDIQLNEQDPAAVREFLISKIPELEGKQQSVIKMFLRLFKI